MKVNNKDYRTIWLDEKNKEIVQIIDQRYLPHKFTIEKLTSVNDFVRAIKDMHVRGAGLIGATAGYGMYIAVLEASKKFKDNVEEFNKNILKSANLLKNARPTAVNLSWAVDRQLKDVESVESNDDKISIALKTAQTIADEDAEYCRRIGEHGLKIIEEIAEKKNKERENNTASKTGLSDKKENTNNKINEVVNILTHCNAGWLAFVDYGSATSPIYKAFDKGIKVHVWVDETRPRNQGARLTAWELGQHGVSHTIISDNVGGHLMQNGMIDLVIVGTDRTTYTGDVANKIGTYLKALAAKDNDIPFYVALPSSSFDWKIKDGREIPIEERNSREVKYIKGSSNGEIKEVLLTPSESNAANYAFDVTPRKLITGLITERGICEANETSILEMFPEKKGD